MRFSSFVLYSVGADWCDLKMCPYFLSVIKTRMQSLQARSQYKNSLDCALKVYSDEGILKWVADAVVWRQSERKHKLRE